MARKDVTDGTIAQDMTDANDNFIELYASKQELEDARDGETTLLAKEQDQDANITTVTDEVIAARDGHASLLAKEQDQDANITALVPFAATGYPDQADKAGQFLSTDGSLPKWVSLNQAIGNINNPLLHMPMNNSLVMNKGVGSVTFSRNTIATYIDRYGVLKTAAIDEPRFEKEGALFEGASTNLALYSQDFSNSAWLISDGTAIGSVLGIDGINNTGYKYTNDSSLDVFQIFTGLTVGDTYSFSCYIRSDTPSNITGGIMQVDGSTTFLNRFHFGGNVTDKYVKIQSSFIASLTNHSVYFISNLITLNSTDTIEIDSPQLEKLPFASSYIPTTSAPVTRGCDLLQIPIIGNSPYYLKNNDMSIMFDIKIYSPTDNSGLIIIYYDDPDDPHLTTLLRAYVLSSNRVLWQYAYSNEGDAAGQINMVIDGDNTFRIAKVIKDGFCTTYTNGKIINVSSEAAYYSTDHIPTSADFINIGRAGYTAFFHISNLRIYDRALTEQEMEIA